MANFPHLLLSRRRSARRRRLATGKAVKGQDEFDQLFQLMFSHDRRLVHTAAEAVNRIVKSRRALLAPHQQQLLAVLHSHDHHDLRPHLPLLVSKLQLKEAALNAAWNMLVYWVRNINEPVRTRVHALEALHELATVHPALKPDLLRHMAAIAPSRQPLLQARLRKLALM